MKSDIIVIVEPFIWIASINKANTVIELSKVADQQHFLISKNSEALVEYFEQIDEKEVKRIDNAAKSSPFFSLGDMDLLFINLN